DLAAAGAAPRQAFLVAVAERHHRSGDAPARLAGNPDAGRAVEHHRYRRLRTARMLGHVGHGHALAGPPAPGPCGPAGRCQRSLVLVHENPVGGWRYSPVSLFLCLSNATAMMMKLPTKVPCQNVLMPRR